MMEKSVQELAEFLHGTVENDNPALVVNRYNFCEEEIAKTKEEALEKKKNRAIQIEARRKVNRGVNV